jgi:hypothetical protein
VNIAVVAGIDWNFDFDSDFGMVDPAAVVVEAGPGRCSKARWRGSSFDLDV